MIKTLTCQNTGYKTIVRLIDSSRGIEDEYANVEAINNAANRLLKREPDHKSDYVTVIYPDRMRSEICRALNDLTEHTGKYREYELTDQKRHYYVASKHEYYGNTPARIRFYGPGTRAECAAWIKSAEESIYHTDHNEVGRPTYTIRHESNIGKWAQPTPLEG